MILIRPIDKETSHYKMIVQGEVYEVSCARYMQEKIKSLHRFRDRSINREARKFVDYWLRILDRE